MHGVIGSKFTLFPTPLKAGAAVSYDGTDFLVLDNCTGLVREVYISQNLIQYFNAMGLTAITGDRNMPLAKFDFFKNMDLSPFLDFPVWFKGLLDQKTSEIEQYLANLDKEVQRLHNEYKDAPVN